jgi:UDPglucose--hexose-1-phosphate uridylyltransferase
MPSQPGGVASDVPHRRYNPLLDEWVLCSPQRLERPWRGMVEEASTAGSVPSYREDCYLCPGNQRASGERNPAYRDTYAFDNDFPALVPRATSEDIEGPIFQRREAGGICRVLCFTPRHDLTLARMDRDDVRKVVDLWASESKALAGRDGIAYVQLFENKGLMMGCSNPHPHAQVWATDHVPTLPARKLAAQQRHHAATGRDLLGQYAEAEKATATRVVWSDVHWLVVVPYWAVWPYQAMLIPARRVTTLDQLDDAERSSLAHAVSEVTRRYDKLFATDTPYSMAWCPAPTPRAHADDGSWRLHGEIFPPLLRSATVRKFMVGYELAAEAQRDLTPEAAAARLREIA